MRALPRTRLCRAISMFAAVTLFVTAAFASVGVAFAADGPRPLPLPSPSTVADAPTASHASTASSDPVVPPDAVEDVSKRTEDSKHYRLADGSYRALISAAPVHYRDSAAGPWKDIDTRLVPATEPGEWATKASPLKIRFGTEAPGRPAARVAGERWSVAMDLIGAAEHDPLVIGTQARYSAVAPATDLVYEASDGGLKESLVLGSATAPGTFTFRLDLTGLTLEQASGAWVLKRDGETEPVATLGDLVVTDSNVDAAGDPAVCADARMTVTPIDGGAYVTYEIPRSWLDDSRRVFPVVVDPTLALTKDTYVASAYPTTAYGSEDHLKAGVTNTSPYTMNRAYIQFDMAALPVGAYARSSTFSLWIYHQYYSTGTRVSYCGYSQSAWSNATTWNTRPAYTAYTSANAVGENRWVNYPVTSLVQSWAQGSLANYGFCVYQTQTTVDYLKEFRSSNYGTASQRPVLAVDYLPTTLTTSGIQSSYRIGSTASITMNAASAVPEELSYLLMFNNYLSAPGVAGPTSSFRGYLGWFATMPDANWEAHQTSDGSYFAVWKNVAADYGSDHFTPLFESCSTTLTPGVGREVTFVYKIPPAWGDQQLNHVDTAYVMAGPGLSFTRGWMQGPERFSVLPSANTASVSGRGLTWHDEAAGAADSGTTGRGAVDLSWTAADAATGYNVYLHDGNAWRKVSSATTTSWTSEGKKIYPSDSAISALATGTASNPFPAGTGLDLRDDPTPLYAKTEGTSLDAFPGYLFKVVPYNSGGEAPLSECATLSVQMPKRTHYLNEPPSDTTIDLGEMAGHSAVAVVDSAPADPARLELSATDLSIASWGPEASLSRTYRSDVTTSSRFAPGWRFNFEQTIESDGGGATWVDASGGRTRFALVDGSYRAPKSVVATLTRDPLLPAEWRLVLKGGTTLTFDQNGRILRETDRNNDPVDYTWGAGTLTITAANRQTIEVTLDPDGKPTRATYLGREITYTSAATSATVSYFPGTDSARTVRYAYASDRLSGLSVPEFTPVAGEPAQWDFTYSNGAAVGSLTHAGRTTQLFYPSGTSAKVTRWGTVGGASNTPVATTYTWDEDGALTSRTNPGSTTDVWGFARNVVGATVMESDPLGGVKRYETDLRGNVTAETDELGHRSTTTYSADDDPLVTTDPVGMVTTRTYAGPNLRTERRTLSALESACTTYSVNASGTVTEQLRSVDATYSEETDYADFAPNGQPQTTTARGVSLGAGGQATDLVTHRYYADTGELLMEKDALNTTTAMNTYLTDGRLASTTDASGTVTHHMYDVLGNETNTWRQSVSGEKAEIVTRIVDAEGRVRSETTFADSAGTVPARVVTYTFDGMGRETAAISSVEGVSSKALDARGNVTEEWGFGASGDANGSTRRAFDALDRAWRETAPGAAVASSTVTTYLADGKELKVISPDGSWESYEYDAAGHRTALLTPADGGGTARTTYEYDLGGRMVRMVSPDEAETLFTYDRLDRRSAAGGSVTGLDVWSAGSGTGSVTSASTTTGGVSSSVAPSIVAGEKRSCELELPIPGRAYNLAGWLMAERDTDGILTSFTYDAAGRELSRQVGDKVSTKDYDSLGRVWRDTAEDGATTSRVFDAFGRAVEESQVSAAGATVKHTVSSFDAAGRSVATTDTISGLVRTMSWSDASKKPISTTERLGFLTATATFSETGVEQGQTASYTARGSLGSTRTATDWDSAQRATEWNWFTSATPGGISSSVTFDAAGRVREQTGIGLTATGTAVYTYGPDGRKSGETIPLAFGGAISGAYDYTPAGRLATATIGPVATRYEHSPAGNVTTVTAGGSVRVLSFEADSNRVSTETVNGAVKATFGWDAAHGWRTSSTRGGVTTGYAYDAAGRLTSVTRAGQPLASFAYDASGQRTESTMTVGGVTTRTHYVYEDLRLVSLAATASTGATWSVNYLDDPSGRPYAAVYDASEEASPIMVGLVTTDRGDVVSLTDEAGATFAAWRYDAFGSQVSTTTGTARVSAALAARIASRQILRYAGYAFDEATSLYYCSARYYDPATFSFITKDPAKADGEESAYQYCGGDPVGKTDPSGEVALRIRAYWNRIHSREPKGWLNGGRRYKYWGRNARRFLQTAQGLVADWYFDRRNSETAARAGYLELKWKLEAYQSVSEAFWLHFESRGGWDDSNYKWFRQRVVNECVTAAQEVGDMMGQAESAAGLLQNIAVFGIRQHYLLPSGWRK